MVQPRPRRLPLGNGPQAVMRLFGVMCWRNVSLYLVCVLVSSVYSLGSGLPEEPDQWAPIRVSQSVSQSVFLPQECFLPPPPESIAIFFLVASDPLSAESSLISLVSKAPPP